MYFKKYILRLKRLPERPIKLQRKENKITEKTLERDEKVGPILSKTLEILTEEIQDSWLPSAYFPPTKFVDDAV